MNYLLPSTSTYIEISTKETEYIRAFDAEAACSLRISWPSRESLVQENQTIAATRKSHEAAQAAVHVFGRSREFDSHNVQHFFLPTVQFDHRLAMRDLSCVLQMLSGS